MPLGRLRDAEIPQQLREALAVLGQVDRVGRGAEDPDAGLLQRQRQLERRLPAELHDAGDVAAGLLLALDDRDHVLEGQRLEVQPVDGVVVGRHRLRVAVDHHRLEALLAQREGGVAAAVVELDALADAVRAAAEDHHLLARRRIRLALLLVGAVHVRRERLELGRAGVDALVGRHRGRARAASPRTASSSMPRIAGEVAIAEAGALERPQHVARHAAQPDQRRPTCRSSTICGELGQEPRIDLGQLVERPRPSSRGRARGTAPTSGGRSGTLSSRCSAPSSSSVGHRVGPLRGLAEQQAAARRARASGTPS